VGEEVNDRKGIDSHFHGNDRGRGRNDRKRFTPTLVLPPQGGGDVWI